MLAIEKAGYKPGIDIALALDVAASEFYKVSKYNFEGNQWDSDAMITYYKELIEEYPIISIEDPLSEDDWQGWGDMTKEIGQFCLYSW